ncbi:MAG: TetR/AcrR family transcriptional regulator [Chthoniobacterales bacterium]|nr:TetR/AcrR family transcriptional regulator [Chthoniobacterales bacterium]
MKLAVDSETREDLILDAADRLLARYGYKKMTVEDVANEAGIGKGTVYLHFRSKEEVVLSHVDRIVRRLLEQLEAIAADSDTAAGRVREMLLLRVMFRFDAVQHYTQSISEVLRDLRSGLLDRRQRHFDREAKVLAAVLKEGDRSGELRCSDPLPTARVLIVATNSLLPFSLSTAELGKRRDVEAHATRIAELLVGGLRRN